MRVIINTLEDAAKGVPMIKTNKPKKLIEGEMCVGVLEHGTVGGNTSIMFMIEEENEVHLGQMTLATLEAVLQAARGADFRFKQLQKQRIKKNGS